MDPVIIIPWRDSGSAQRTHRLARVQRHLHDHLPDYPVILADDPRWGRFNRAAARNAGVKQAAQLGADTIITCDADTLLDPAAVTWAVTTARRTGMLVHPFTWYVSLDWAGTQAAIAGDWPPEPTWTDWGRLDWSPGGSMVTSVDLWGWLGGMDERFEGWGGEDMALVLAHRALLGEDTLRPSNPDWCCWHLAHDPDNEPGSDLHTAYVDHFRRWTVAADQGADAVRALQSEHAETLD